MRVEEYLEQLFRDIARQKSKFDNYDSLVNYIESRMRSEGYMVDRKFHTSRIPQLITIPSELDIYESVIVITRIYTKFIYSFYLNDVPSDNSCAIVINHGLIVNSDFQLLEILNNLNEIKVFHGNWEMVDLIEMKGRNFRIEDNKVIVYNMFDNLDNFNLGYLIKGGSSFYSNRQIDFRLYFDFKGNPPILFRLPLRYYYYIEYYSEHYFKKLNRMLSQLFKNYYIETLNVYKK